MTESKLAVSTQVFGEHEVTAHHLDVMRNAGFGYVEVFAAPGHFAWDDERAVAQMARWLRERDMRACSLHAPWAPGQDIAALDDAQRARSLRAVERAADALVVLGGEYLIVHPGATLTDPTTKDRQLHLAQESLATIARYCATLGVMAALENPPPYELGGDPADMLPLYAQLAGELALCACFDTGHAHISSAGVAGIAHVPKVVAVIHLSDNTGKTDDHWPPPAGTIVWRDFFRLLARRQWDGYLLLELTNQADALDVLTKERRWLIEMLDAHEQAG
jgi:sugar phosphate isomerase/epimerase